MVTTKHNNRRNRFRLVITAPSRSPRPSQTVQAADISPTALPKGPRQSRPARLSRPARTAAPLKTSFTPDCPLSRTAAPRPGPRPTPRFTPHPKSLPPLAAVLILLRRPSPYHYSPAWFSRLAAVLILLLQTSSLFAAENIVIDLNPPRVIRGQNAGLRIRTTLNWSDTPVIIRPELPPGLAWWGLPRPRQWFVPAPDGRRASLVEVNAVIRVSREGIYTIPPIRIRSGDSELITDPVEIIGLRGDEAHLPYPVSTRWRPPIPPVVWQGQAVPIVLEAVNLTSLALSESTVFTAAPQGLLEEAPELGEIITRPHRNDILYDVPMGSWVWTPGDAGTRSFPGTRISVNGLTRTAPEFTIRVKPLPEAVASSGAVGIFTLALRIDEGPYRVGEVISLRIRVEGEGSMSTLKPPEPRLSGAELVNRGSSSSYRAGPLGYKGWREERRDFRIERAGPLELTIPEWPWLEPGEEPVIRRSAVTPPAIIAEAAAPSTEPGLAEHLLGERIFRRRASVLYPRRPLLHIVGLPGLIVFAILILTRHFARLLGTSSAVLLLLTCEAPIDTAHLRTAARAKTAALNGDWLLAEELLTPLIADYPNLPGLLHDLALIRAETKQPDRSVLLIRRALHLRPGNPGFTASLRAIENHLELTDQIPVPLSRPPMPVFILWWAALNLLPLTAARFLHRRDGRNTILLICALILVPAAGGALLYTRHRWQSPTGIVTAAASPLKKIPGSPAGDWIQLPPGSAVSLTAVQENDALVLTGYGLLGWLPISSLALVNEI